MYFIKCDDDLAIYLLLYVDETFIATKDKAKVKKVKAQLSEEFEMKDLDAVRKILGVEILRDIKVGRLY